MTRNKVMKLWNVVVTAFLALFAALGFTTTSATAATATAVPQTESVSNSTAQAPAQAVSLSPWSKARLLPPTMKQRIRAEAHGKSPSCRHRPLTQAEASGTAADPARTDCDSRTSVWEEALTLPLQRR
ncbi:hypothetical protein ADL00_26100 [Streptomyces sp. AS58]|uniref:Secreted protein n=1 Tax=Streptomyces cadmiisoli TaxID=2184053 RepID=A0A2Z4J2E1_9ACTN|nr:MULTISPECIES: DUF6344 domain-containing protein [Streptomyces]AWW38613.1 hypothetical protein DN051_19735 [Streptomyces cadmiisoli]KOV58359.1 hypothetical protein ADL00_26100 [Streptomyces sp. AS58]